MKRLLKIKEFFHLKKRDWKEDSSQSDRPAKRPRKAAAKLKDDGEYCTEATATVPTTISSPKNSSSYDKFLRLFEKDVAKDVVWWLPGRRGEAFAMNRERFEFQFLKMQFEEHSFSGFLESLNRWGFRQMNIPSLSGKVLTFEKGSQGTIGDREAGRDTDRARQRNPIHMYGRLEELMRVTGAVSSPLPPTDLMGMTIDADTLARLSALQLQQAHYIAQQEISQTYFTLLWQELQRQLSLLFLLQSQTPVADATAEDMNSDNGQQQQAPRSGSSSSPSTRSEIANVASLLHQHQIQQQIVAAQYYQAALTEPSRIPSTEPETVVRELNDLHQQQLSNLTYQIVALVAASLEQQNQNPLAQQEPPVIHKLLVKYLLALVLLQLQQQQYNMEFVRQDKLNALALIRSIRRMAAATANPSANAAVDSPLAASRPAATTTTTSPTLSNSQASTSRNGEEEEPAVELVTSAQMPHMLAEAAMLSLSRAHQLLVEASILIPQTLPPPPPPAPRPNQDLAAHRAPPVPNPRDQDAPAGRPRPSFVATTSPPTAAH